MVLRLTPDERQVLARWAQRGAAAPEARRARVILRLAAATSYRAVSAAFGCSLAYVSRWRRRFAADRVEGLRSSRRRVAPRVATPEMVSRILVATQQPPDGLTFWSTRTLGRHLGVHHNVVARVWRENGIQPTRAGRRSSPRAASAGGAQHRLAAVSPKLPALWAELAAFGAADTDAALDHLLRSFGALVDARDGYWLGAVRLAGVPPQDPLNGWRPGALRWLEPTREKERFYRRAQYEIDHGIADITTLEHVRRAGCFARCSSASSCHRSGSTRPTTARRTSTWASGIRCG